MRQGTRIVAIPDLVVLIGIGGLIFGDATTPPTPSPLLGSETPYTI